MAKSRKKLNSMRWLERQKIEYEVIAFDDTIHSAQGVAAFIGVSVRQVFKTLVVITDTNKPLLVLVGGDCGLDLKQLAAAVGHKKVRMAAHEEAEKLTGLQTGGISALALTMKGWPVVVEAAAAEFDVIYMSAGQRGINVKVSRVAFVDAMQAQLVRCCSPLQDDL